MNAPKPVFHKIVPMLPVSDLGATIDYYTEKLGFYDAWTWGEPAVDGGVRRDHLRLIFGLNPEMAAHTKGMEVMVFVDEPDALYTEFSAKGVEILSEPEDKPWGVREFSIRDINGYVLRIGGELAKSADSV